MVSFTYVRHIVALWFYNQFRVPCSTLKRHTGKCIQWEKKVDIQMCLFVCIIHISQYCLLLDKLSLQ